MKKVKSEKVLKESTTGNTIETSSETHGSSGRVRDGLAALNTRLERHPWSRLGDSDDGGQLELRLLLDAAGQDGRAWIVTMPDGMSLPGPMEADLYVAIGQLYNSQIPMEERETRRRVVTTFGELVTIMQRQRGGSVYRALRRAVERLQDTVVRTVTTYPDGGIKAEEARYHLLGEVKYQHLRNGDKGATGIVITMPDDLVTGDFRLLNTTLYFSLETPTAKRLLRLLDLRSMTKRGGQWVRQAEKSFTLAELAKDLPLEGTSPSIIKRPLDKAHEQLIEAGFLQSATYEDRAVPGKKRPQVWVNYRFADRSVELPKRPLLIAAPRVEGTRADYLQDMVNQILRALKDEHSTAFYVKVVQTLPEEVVRHILADVTGAVREGRLSLETARKTFTATCQIRMRQQAGKS